jgi:hypothetical protein
VIAVALALAAALVAVVASFAGVVRSLIRQHARERDLLINQLLHATGNAWQPSPAAEQRREARGRDFDGDVEIRWTPSPEQLPTQ